MYSIICDLEQRKPIYCRERSDSRHYSVHSRREEKANQSKKKKKSKQKD